MDPRKLHFPIVTVGAGAQPDRLCGNAFPLTQDGDLLTCRHVVSVSDESQLAVLNLATNQARLVREVIYPQDDDLDLALLPRAAVAWGGHRFPLLPPGVLLVGEDVSTYGHYSHGGSWATRTDGYFKGNVVAFRTEKYVTATLSYPVIEGLSGSPVTMPHNGRKLVGICFGSESQRVLASEILDFKDGRREVHETVHRIVEFGLAYRVEVIQAFCAEVGIEPWVTPEAVNDPELA